jgi:hypothetical protein
LVGSLLVGHGGFGRLIKCGEDIFLLSLDYALDGLEISSSELMR